MAQLMRVEDGTLFEVAVYPVYDREAGLWRCGDRNFADPNGEEFEPVGPIPGARRTRVSRPEFKQLLTAAERIAIRAARSYAGAAAAAQQLKAALDDLFDILDDPALTHVDLTLPTTQQGIAMLAEAGLVAHSRVPEILAGWQD